MSVVDLARAEIRRVVDDLRGIRYRLVGVQASIVPSLQETSEEDMNADVDAPTEIRAVLAACLSDWVDPLLRDLSAVLCLDENPKEPGALFFEEL